MLFDRKQDVVTSNNQKKIILESLKETGVVESYRVFVEAAKHINKAAKILDWDESTLTSKGKKLSFPSPLDVVIFKFYFQVQNVEDAKSLFSLYFKSSLYHHSYTEEFFDIEKLGKRGIWIKRIKEGNESFINFKKLRENSTYLSYFSENYSNLKELQQVHQDLVFDSMKKVELKVERFSDPKMDVIIHFDVTEFPNGDVQYSFSVEHEGNMSEGCDSFTKILLDIVKCSSVIQTRSKIIDYMVRYDMETAKLLPIKCSPYKIKESESQLLGYFSLLRKELKNKIQEEKEMINSAFDFLNEYWSKC